MTKRILFTIIILIIITVMLFAACLILWFGRKVTVTIDKDVEGLSAELQEIFCLASLAPNSHNIQSRMVTVYPKDGLIEIRTDENSNIRFYDMTDDGFEKIGSATMEAYEKQAYDKNASGETFARQGIATCEKQVYNSSGFIVISGNDDEASLFDCGRETVRLWLALTENGISVQPLSYALEDDEYKKTVAEAGGPLQPQMLLRVGYVDDYGENSGIRRDLSDYITVVD